ncbi:WD40 repeat-like protein [Nadsonia fulvescens var. elongata DSM 6958]|uniref:Mitochondrial division protein 1 n=1 Tax=Nadsonia fulvescens var. elongata DSM 6958 TaxID=857566 RepID=A0A1E3PLK3_9ASCO|nr:WD40 repeat-like protein [Nadsonia fulvescens var. elongata DSM 6958]
MKDITGHHRSPSFQKRMFAFSSGRPPSEVMKGATRKEIQYKAVTALPEEMLQNIPNGDDGFSLFQGFQASIPLLDEMVSRNKKVKALENGESKNPDDDLPDAINRQKNTIIRKLDLLEIRKALAANEIREIDGRIGHLQTMRQVVFDKVANLEKEEIHLENSLQQVEIKLDEALELMKLESKQSKGQNHLLENEDFYDSNQDTPGFMSQSIYTKIQENPPRSGLSSKLDTRKAPTKTKLNRHSGGRKRKTMPTLQKYYQPGEEIRTIQAHSDMITSLDFDFPFGTMISASTDDSVKVWDLSKGRCVSNLAGHNAYVSCLQIEDNILATGSMDASVKIWDLSKIDMYDDTDDIMEEEEGQENLDGDNQTVKDFSTSTNRIGNSHDSCVYSLESHLGEISALHFQGNTLVSGSADKTIRQWDMQTGKCVQTLDVLWAAAQVVGSGTLYNDDPRWKKQMNSSAAYNSQGLSLSSAASFIGALQCYDAALATGTADGMVRLWDLRSGQVHRQLVGHTGPVTCLQFDDYHLATGSLDRSVRIWDLRTGTIFDAFAYDSPISSLHFDSKQIVTCNNESTVKIYDRVAERHWTCGAGEIESDAAKVETAKCIEGYLVEGREDGKIGIWSC